MPKPSIASRASTPRHVRPLREPLRPRCWPKRRPSEDAAQRTRSNATTRGYSTARTTRMTKGGSIVSPRRAAPRAPICRVAPTPAARSPRRSFFLGEGDASYRIQTNVETSSLFSPFSAGAARRPPRLVVNNARPSRPTTIKSYLLSTTALKPRPPSPRAPRASSRTSDYRSAAALSAAGCRPTPPGPPLDEKVSREVQRLQLGERVGAPLARHRPVQPVPLHSQRVQVHAPV